MRRGTARLAALRCRQRADVVPERDHLPIQRLEHGGGEEDEADLNPSELDPVESVEDAESAFTLGG